MQYFASTVFVQGYWVISHRLQYFCYRSYIGHGILPRIMLSFSERMQSWYWTFKLNVNYLWWISKSHLFKLTCTSNEWVYPILDICCSLPQKRECEILPKFSLEPNWHMIYINTGIIAVKGRTWIRSSHGLFYNATPGFQIGKCTVEKNQTSTPHIYGRFYNAILQFQIGTPLIRNVHTFEIWFNYPMICGWETVNISWRLYGSR